MFQPFGNQVLSAQMSALKFSGVEAGHGCVQREQVICSADSLKLWDCSSFPFNLSGVPMSVSD